MSLDLLVVRHAIAEDVAASGRDEDRALTREGRERMQAAVRGLAALDLRLDRVLHSPWVRARQTAELLAPLGGACCSLHACPQLAQAPGHPLLELLDAPRLALVGHEPWLSQLVAWLACGARERGTAFELRKGSVARLEGAPRPGGMVLRALWPPATLRRLGR